MKNRTDGSLRGEIGRRDFLRRAAGTAIGLSALSGLPLIGCGGQSAPATPTPASSPKPSSSAPAASSAAPTVDEAARLAKLTEAAKAEGKVVWYTEISGDDQKNLIDAFEKKYPFLKVEAWRGSNEAMRDKFVAEFKAGRNTADVTGGWADSYITDGLSKKWDNPAAKVYPKGMFHPEGHYFVSILYILVPAYNTDLVKPQEAPKSWDDLLDPKWKGKMVLDRDDTAWFAAVLQHRGREKGLEYMRALAKQDVAIRKGHTDLSNLLVAGEYHIGVAAYNYYIEQLKEKGAPVEWIHGIPQYTNPMGGITIASKAPHPNAAQLFAEWMTSAEGQTIIRNNGRIPARFTDVKPKVSATVDNLQIYGGNIPGWYDQEQKDAPLFQDLFWPKS